MIFSSPLPFLAYISIFPKRVGTTLFTYLNVKEDALDIYGFETEQEMQFFTLLISISGVGPKVAIAILSELQPDSFANCIITSDIKRKVA